MHRIRTLVTAWAALFAAGAVLAGFSRGDEADEQRSDRGKLTFEAQLDGFQQVPSFSSTGTGDVRVRLNASGDAAEYEVSYTDVAGTAILFAHLHFGRPGTNGGVIAYLCSNAPPLADVPACPDSPGGRVSGTLDASRVVGPIGQGIAAGDFEALVRALRAGATYVNLHTNASSPGEVRGDLR